MKSKKIKFQNLNFFIMFLALVSVIPAARAQEQQPEPSVQLRNDFSDDELQSFIQANEHIMDIQKEGEQNMIKAIEDQGLTVNRFHEILEAQRDPQRTGDSTASAEEMQSFNNAAQVILQENARLEKEMSTRIEEVGIDIETYKQIMIAYQQDPDLQNRINKMAGQDQAPSPGQAQPQDQSDVNQTPAERSEE